MKRSFVFYLLIVVSSGGASFSAFAENTAVPHQVPLGKVEEWVPVHLKQAFSTTDSTPEPNDPSHPGPNDWIAEYLFENPDVAAKVREVSLAARDKQVQDLAHAGWQKSIEACNDFSSEMVLSPSEIASYRPNHPLMQVYIIGVEHDVKIDILTGSLRMGPWYTTLYATNTKAEDIRMRIVNSLIDANQYNEEYCRKLSRKHKALSDIHKQLQEEH